VENRKEIGLCSQVTEGIGDGSRVVRVVSAVPIIKSAIIISAESGTENSVHALSLRSVHAGRDMVGAGCYVKLPTYRVGRNVLSRFENSL